ncbi:MAG: type II toxin-antitoxin system RelE/ParE family toxin [Cyanobacteria bacterium]|nr:type II toxin-antitoxin system RelE/ParE family toxin [Cyanobacteriota bacterium]
MAKKTDEPKQSDSRKDLMFVTESLRNEMREWPDSARVDAGDQLRLVQDGKEPGNFKPFPQIGQGAYEIRTQDEDKKQYRVFYVAKFSEAVYVLHVITGKTSQKTPISDVEIAKNRYQNLIKWRREEGLDKNVKKGVSESKKGNR